jgi:hypothetical protein
MPGHHQPGHHGRGIGPQLGRRAGDGGVPGESSEPGRRRPKRLGLGPSHDGDAEAGADEAGAVSGGGAAARAEASWIGEALADGYGAVTHGAAESGTATADMAKGADGAAAAW